MSWRRIRREVLERDGWICVECQSPIKGRNAHAHHKLPRGLGGLDTLENLISLCSGCHSLKHMNLQASLGRRLIERIAVRVARLFDKTSLADLDGGKLGLALRYLNIDRLRKGQLEPILAALNNKSVLFISPTGSGKSLCFQLPALLKEEKSLVISPLKALMSDQVGGLLNREYPATFINSDLPKKEKELRLELIKKNKFKLVYLAPERLEKNERMRAEQQVILGSKLGYLIVDEAHCIDKWGDAFRPSYTKIGSTRSANGNPPVLAFTATAGRKTRRRILENLDATDAEVFIQGVDRPNIALMRFNASEDEKRVALVKELFLQMSKKSAGKCLIFVPTRKLGEKVKELLLKAEIKSEFFHGKLNASQRDFLLGRFEGRLEEEVNLLICTNAFGMGMDIPNIRLVFHWQHPSSPEDYLQEFGRAGRDQKQALAVLFTSENDTGLLDFMLKKSLEKLNVNEEERAEIYQTKRDSIDIMSDMSSAKKLCFSEYIKSELDIGKSKTTFSTSILEWAFAEKKENLKRRFCCDACWRKTYRQKRKISDFARQVISIMPDASSTAISLSSEPTTQKSNISDQLLEKERTDVFLFVIILILVLYFLAKPMFEFL